MLNLKRVVYRRISENVIRRTPAFSCGARLACKLKEKDYLRNMLSRRQLQGLCWAAA